MNLTLSSTFSNLTLGYLSWRQVTDILSGFLSIPRPTSATLRLPIKPPTNIPMPTPTGPPTSPISAPRVAPAIPAPIDPTVVTAVLIVSAHFSLALS